jgi:hypothetical protein
MPELDPDPFARCYVHDGGLPRVELPDAKGAGTKLVLRLTVNVCGLCRATHGDGAIRRRLQAQYETATAMIGKLGR